MKSIKKLSVLVFLCFVFTTCVPSIVSIAKTLDGERPKVVFSSNAFILAEQVNVQLQKLDEELEQTYILDIKNLQKNNALEISAEKINDEDTLYTIKKKIPSKTIYYSDGSVSKEFSTRAVSATETQDGQEIVLWAQMKYETRAFGKISASRLTHANGRVVKLNERRFRNFQIMAKCSGDAVSSSGAGVGLQREGPIVAPVSSPGNSVWGFEPNFKYYYLTDSLGYIHVEVSAEWTHGTTNSYPYKVSLQIGAVNII